MIQVQKTAVDGQALQITMESFSFDKELEFTLNSSVIPFDTVENTSKLDAIDAIQASEIAKARARERWKSLPIFYKSQGSYVDAQGNDVFPDPETGELPEGAIPAKDFWYNIPATSPAVPGATTIGAVLTGLIQQAMLEFEV